MKKTDNETENSNGVRWPTHWLSAQQIKMLNLIQSQWLLTLTLCFYLGFGFAPQAQAHCTFDHPGHCFDFSGDNMAQTIDVNIVKPVESLNIPAANAVTAFTSQQLMAVHAETEKAWNTMQTLPEVTEALLDDAATAAVSEAGKIYANEVLPKLEVLKTAMEAGWSTANSAVEMGNALTNVDGEKIGSTFLQMIGGIGAVGFGLLVDALDDNNAGSLLLIHEIEISVPFAAGAVQRGIAVDVSFLKWLQKRMAAGLSISPNAVRNNYDGHIISMFNIVGGALTTPTGGGGGAGFIIGYHVSPPSGVGGPSWDTGIQLGPVDVGVGIDISDLKNVKVVAGTITLAEPGLAMSTGFSYGVVVTSVCHDWTLRLNGASCNPLDTSLAANYGDWGDWGPEVHCPKGTYAYSYDIRILSPLGSSGAARDDVAATNVRLKCRDVSFSQDHTVYPPLPRWFGGHLTGDEPECPRNGFLRDEFLAGSQIRVEPEQGSGDDTGMNALKMQCGSSATWLEAPNQGHWGDWQSQRSCPSGMVITGLKAKIESYQGRFEDFGVDDDTGLNNVEFFCTAFEHKFQTSLRNVNSNLCMDTDNNGNVLQRTCHSGLSQLWTFETVPNRSNFYTIKSNNDNRCLRVAERESTMTLHFDLALSNCVSDSGDQQFGLWTDPTSGDINFQADFQSVYGAANGGSIAVAGNSAAQAANVQIQHDHISVSSYWQLTDNKPLSELNPGTPLAWNQVPGSAQDISIGADGSVWSVGTNSAHKNNYGIFKLQGANWIQNSHSIGGRQIAVDPNGIPWKANSLNVFRGVDSTANTDWTSINMAGYTNDISIGADGSIWKISSWLLPNRVHKWDGMNWIMTSGIARRIAVQPDGIPWIVTADGYIFRAHDANASGWTQVPGFARDIAIGSDGTVWITGFTRYNNGRDHAILKWTGSSWQQTTGYGVDIAVDPNGNPWVVTSDKKIWTTATFAPPSLVTDQTTYAISINPYPPYVSTVNSVVANFAGGPGNATDWIGLFKQGDIPGVTPSIEWFYTNGTKTPGGHATEGTVTFNNVALGVNQNYDLYFLSNDGYAQLAGPISVSTTAALLPLF